MDLAQPCAPRNWQKAGKQSHGSARTREVKLSTIWSAEPFDEHQIPVRAEGSVNYSTTQRSAAARDTAIQLSPLTQRARRHASPRRFCQAPRTLVRGDGTAGIWNLASDRFPEPVQMVDRFHAQQHGSELEKSSYNSTDSQAAPWAKRRQKAVDAGQFRLILTAIRRNVARCEEARLHYFQTNQTRMCYPEFHVRGLCTFTRVVEAGCEVALGTRRKRAEMHWTVRGNNAIIAPRCCKPSGRFEDFRERRSERRAA